MHSPQRLVIDASVLIDLEKGGLFSVAVRLVAEWLMPDLIAEEFLAAPASLGLPAGMFSLELCPEQVAEASAVRAQHRSLSLQDASALALARSLGAMLLAGDGPLRRIAGEAGLNVHGTLWVLDELVARCIVNGSRAADALEAMISAGSRLPEGPCQDRIGRWRRP